MFPYLVMVLVCAWLRSWYKFLSSSLSHFVLQKLPNLLTRFFTFLQHYAWQPVCLMAVIVFPSCSPVFSLAVNLSCVVLTFLCWSSPCPVPKAWHHFCLFVALSCSVLIKSAQAGAAGVGTRWWAAVINRSYKGISSNRSIKVDIDWFL